MAKEKEIMDKAQEEINSPKKKAAAANSEKKDNRFRNLQIYSAITVVLLIGIVLLVNFVFDKIIGKKLEFDLTSTEQNSISQETKDYIDSLPDDTHIRIVGLMERPEDYRGSEYEYIVPLLDDYNNKSGGKVTVEYIDPESHPSIMSELDPSGVYDLTANIYVLSYKGKLETIVPLYCFTYDQQYLNYGQYLPTGNMVESTFTNAIINLTKGYSHKAYFVNGLTDYSHTQFANILNNIGFEVGELQASDDMEIPSDCEMIIINGLDRDIPEGMYLSLHDYLNNANDDLKGVRGKLIVALDYSQINSGEKFTNLNKLLNEFNISVTNKMAMENDPDYVLSAQNGLAYADPGSMYQSMANNGKIKTYNARILSPADYNRSWITTENVLLTSSKALSVYIEETTDENGQKTYTPVYDKQNQYSVGMYSTYEMTDPPLVYVFGTMALTSDEYINSYGYNDTNVVLIRNIIRTMFGVTEVIDVQVRPLANYSVDPEKVTQSNVSTMIFVMMVIIPLTFVIIGVVVYKKRKNL